MLRFKDVTRKQAFITHLLISFMIFLVILYFLIFNWYPIPFFSTDGGWQGIQLIAGIDLILGPSLTLLLFKPGKPGLKFDMIMVAIFQVSALIPGVWIVHKERPVAVVFSVDKFRPVPAYQVTEGGMKLEDLYKLDSQVPVRVYVDIPQDEHKISALRNQAFMEGLSLYQLGKYYKPLNKESFLKIKQQELDLDAYIEDKPQYKNTYYQLKLKYKDNFEQYSFYPIHSRYENFIAMLDNNTYQIVDVLKILPPTDINTLPKVINVRQDFKSYKKKDTQK